MLLSWGQVHSQQGGPQAAEVKPDLPTHCHILPHLVTPHSSLGIGASYLGCSWALDGNTVSTRDDFSMAEQEATMFSWGMNLICWHQLGWRAWEESDSRRGWQGQEIRISMLSNDGSSDMVTGLPLSPPILPPNLVLGHPLSVRQVKSSHICYHGNP